MAELFSKGACFESSRLVAEEGLEPNGVTVEARAGSKGTEGCCTCCGRQGKAGAGQGGARRTGAMGAEVEISKREGILAGGGAAAGMKGVTTGT